jgi:hypothetical protein
MLDDPELRAGVSRIRNRAEEMRIDFKRHSKEPEWELLRDTVLAPLHELRDLVAEELARREKTRPTVPIDRDPVPRTFAEKVREYYERIGAGADETP